jgi:tetratricopeptide (TPR) repeat protein
MPTAAEVLGRAWGLYQAGRFVEAEQAYREAAALDPANSDTWCFVGLCCRAQGKNEAAAEGYRAALRLRPDFVEALNNLGNVLVGLGRPEEAVPCYERALRARQDYAQAHNNLGAALRALGQVEQAAACYRRALELAPSYADAHNNLGDALSALGEWEQAAACYRQALVLRPGFAEALTNLGVALLRLGKIDEATASHEQALRLRPDSCEAHNNLGNAYYARHRPAEAARCYREALRIQPDHAEAHYNLGIALAEQGQLDEAVASYREALRLKPGHVEACGNLGHALRGLGRLDEALACYHQLLELKPNDPEAHMSRALVWLLLGDYERGWPEYEWRWRAKEFGRLPYTQPAWDGSPLQGRTILLHAEQGLGDTLQFARYAAPVKACGGRVVLLCLKPLRQILAGLPGVDELAVAREPLPAFDVYAPLLSLPALLGTTLETVPCQVPYLAADPALVEHWGRELGRKPGFRVGIVWQGNPDNRGDRQRSIPLRHFAPLAAVPGVRLLSLQKGAGVEQLRAIAGSFLVDDLGGRLDEAAGPFMDTAAVLKNLDLLVTADTATAHLAGAMAVPTWLALSAVSDPRWLLGRADSPWYPTVRLFRQARFGDWDPVFARLAGELCPLAEARRPGPITVEVSAGELLDKLTILQIKRERIPDPGKLANVRAELSALEAARDRSVRLTAEVERLAAELKAVNEALWAVEDDLRACEAAADFGPRFVELARSVYRHNDRRADLKRRINDLLGSRLREEKSYAPYRA